MKKVAGSVTLAVLASVSAMEKVDIRITNHYKSLK